MKPNLRRQGAETAAPQSLAGRRVPVGFEMCTLIWQLRKPRDRDERWALAQLAAEYYENQTRSDPFFVVFLSMTPGISIFVTTSEASNL
jgi:hypothetical protein